MKNFIKKYLFTNLLIEKILFFLAQKINKKFELFYPSNLHYKKNTLRKVSRNGIKFELDISDYQAYIIYFDLKTDDSKILLKYINHIKEGIIIDVGANIGQTSLWIANQLTDEIFIYAFEPFYNTYQKMMVNFNLNRYQNIIPENLAIGSKIGTVNMENTIETNSGGKHILSNTATNKNFIQITQTSLDEYFKTTVSKIQFIKIDVEGYEMEVLIGTKNIIEKNKPLFFIELNDQHLKRQNSSAKMLVEFLSNYNYNIQHAETLELIDLNYNFENCHFDIICK